ncbi:MAG: TonB-dependent receptor, partial [Acidobacteria bacterium]|nr:TonB-dependent receptor [Acidobacteriota bacterium]
MTKLFYFSLLSVSTLLAQSNGVEGTVTDPSGAPVPGARITCSGQTATAGLDGRFRLPGAASCEAQIGAPGFATATVPLRPAEPARIVLAIEGLSERVVVTATRREATLEEAGVAGDILTHSDIARRDYPMVVDLLREVPGITATRSGRMGGQTSLFMRGAARTGTLFLLDGMPVNDPGGEMNYGALDSVGLDRIEVIRGPQSALFGAEASSGVIQAFTRRGDPEQRVPHGTLSYERGNFGTDRWLANLRGGSGERIDYSLNAQQLHSAGAFPNDAFRDTSGSANVGFRLAPTTELRAVYRSHDAWLGVPGQVKYGLLNTDAFETTRDNSVSVQLDDVRGSHFAQQVLAGFHRSVDWYNDPVMQGPVNFAMLVRDVYTPSHRVYRVAMLNPANLPTALGPDQRIIQRSEYIWNLDEPSLNQSQRTRAEYQGTVTHSGGALVFGYMYERHGADLGTLDATRNNHGLFFHEQYAIGNRIVLAGGARVEHSSAFGNIFTPRGAVSVRLAGEHGFASSTMFRVSAGRGVTQPSLLQTYARTDYYQGNPDLRPEKTTSYETGLVQEWFGRRLRTEAAVFHNSFRNLISFVSLPPPVWGSWSNVEASRARGLELSAKARITGYLSLNGSYTRLWTRVVASNRPND